MNKTWMPIAAGVMDIIIGIASIASGLFFIILAIFFIVGEMQYLRIIYIPGAIFVVIAGILTLNGGMYAFQRKKWRSALTGAIVACPALALLALIPFIEYGDNPASFLILLWGVAAIVLTVLSRKEFN